MTVDETLARLKELYYRTTQATIEDAFDEAIDLLKTMPDEADRERAAVYMEGLAEMRQEWKSANSGANRRGGKPRPKQKPPRS
jgi:hypothetical protein